MFVARVSKGGVRKYVGRSTTKEGAFQLYKAAKELEIKLLAEKWKVNLSDLTYQALLNYKVEITD